MEKADFMEKPIALAQLSQQYIEKFWKIGAETLKFYAQVTFNLYPIYDALLNAITREISLSSIIPQLFLTRFTFIQPYDIDTGTSITLEQDYLPSEVVRPNVSFMLNVTAARKIATELSRRATPKISKPAVSPKPTFAPLPEPELAEETAKTAFDVVADLQSQFTSKLAPSIKGMTSALQEYSKKKILPPPLVAVSKPLFVSPAVREAPQPHFLEVSAEKDEAKVGLTERLKAESSVTPSLPDEKSEFKAYTTVSMPSQRLSLEAVKSFEYATSLPKVFFEQKIPILNAAAALHLPPAKKSPKVVSPEKPKPYVNSQVSLLQHEEARGEIQTASQEKEPQLPFSANVQSLSSEAAKSFGYAVEFTNVVLENEIPFIKTIAAFSSVSSLSSPAALVVEPPEYSPSRATFPSMSLTQKTSSPVETAPHLTSWIYEVSQTLRDTQLSLSSIPLAASNAQRVVRETLMQPISSFKAPLTLGAQQTFSSNFKTSEEVGIENEGVEAFALPLIVSSQIAAHNQRYSSLFSEPTVTQVYGTYSEPTPIAPKKTAEPGKMSEIEGFSKLPTAIAQAAAETLIVPKLQPQFTGLIEEMQIVRSSYGEELSELGTVVPARTSTLKESAAAPASSSALERLTPPIKSSMQAPARPNRVSPTIPSSFNITVAGESTEEDLRDLESKIGKILSEQIRRYYGSTRI